MRIDPKGTIGGYPALLVRKSLRCLRGRFQWSMSDLEAAAGLADGSGYALVNALRTEGLVKAAGCGSWSAIA